MISMRSDVMDTIYLSLTSEILQFLHDEPRLFLPCCRRCARCCRFLVPCAVTTVLDDAKLETRDDRCGRRRLRVETLGTNPIVFSMLLVALAMLALHHPLRPRIRDLAQLHAGHPSMLHTKCMRDIDCPAYTTCSCAMPGMRVCCHVHANQDSSDSSDLTDDI